MGNVIV